MKITWQDVRELEDFIQRLEDDKETQYYDHDSGLPNPWAYFANHPHLLLPFGFDEYVSFENRQEFAQMWFKDGVEDTQQSIYRRPEGQWLLLYLAPSSRYGTLDFHSKSTWPPYEESTYPYEDRLAYVLPIRDIFRRLYKLADTWIDEEKTLWTPTLWTPDAQIREQSALDISIRGILDALRQERADLRSLSGRQLEDIVAEILRSHGLEIHVVRDTPRGGRDIVARGQLIPGQEPLTMAVEVMHQESVDRPEVQMALWQNRQYPALMFVTSGQFTAGVLKEKALPENQLRLFLKDGVALGDLIKDYFFLRKSPPSPPPKVRTSRAANSRRIHPYARPRDSTVLKHVVEARARRANDDDSASKSSAAMLSARRIFLSYANEDESLRASLEKHLSSLERSGRATIWHRGKMLPGDDPTRAIEAQLSTADVVLLLVTADFLASETLHEEQLRPALARRERDGARVVPILAKPCAWTTSALANLEPLPKNRTPIILWSHPDEAWADVANGITKVIESFPFQRRNEKEW
jgi:hypothetical protein